jgi:hypothetical protein
MLTGTRHMRAIAVAALIFGAAAAPAVAHAHGARAPVVLYASHWGAAAGKAADLSGPR